MNLREKTNVPLKTINILTLIFYTALLAPFGFVFNIVCFCVAFCTEHLKVINPVFPRLIPRNISFVMDFKSLNSRTTGTSVAIIF